MSKVDKKLEKMRNNPKDWRIEDIQDIASRYGFTARKNGGSHVVFTHPKLIEQLCVPAHRPVKPIYVKKLIALMSIINSEE